MLWKNKRSLEKEKKEFREMVQKTIDEVNRSLSDTRLRQELALSALQLAAGRGQDAEATVESAEAFFKWLSKKVLG
jgi:hypothetical protein